MGLNGHDAGGRLSLENGCWFSNTIDQLAEDRSGWVPPFDSSSTASDGLSIHV